MYAIDINDGKVIWSKYSSSSFNSDIKVYKDKFLTIDFDNIIRAISTKDGKELWNFIKPLNPTLLSSPSRNNESRLGKRLWVRNHIPGTKLILAFRVNKKQYSQRNSILIDDMPRTIEEWKAEGGIGILHTSAASTIEQLKQLG